MKQKAIDEALVRLTRVREAIATLNRPECTRAEIRTAWETFLIAANNIYIKLEKGSEGHGPSEGWFGRKKHERKKDEMLSYLHIARNSEEHTIEGNHAEHGIHVSSGNKWTKIENDGLDGNNVRVTIPEGKKMGGELTPSGYSPFAGMRPLP